MSGRLADKRFTFEIPIMIIIDIKCIIIVRVACVHNYVRLLELNVLTKTVFIVLKLQ